MLTNSMISSNRAPFLIIQHCPTTPSGFVSTWLTKNKLPFKLLQADKISDWHSVSESKSVVLLGGTMNIGEEESHPWLIQEYRTVEKLINNKAKILGLCLGLQIIAKVMGSRVYQQDKWEVGFHPVHLKDSNQTIEAFHWHKFASDLPKDCRHLAQSECTFNQGFSFSNNVLAYQFHPETEIEWVKECVDDSEPIPEGKFCQNREQILSRKKNLPNVQDWFEKKLDVFFS